MIIHKLEMYNFRQYIDLQEISFSTDPEKNVTVLIGVNTSGKTTKRQTPDLNVLIIRNNSSPRGH